MNKEYTYLDGKVIIQDDDEKRLEEYQDNIDEILAQENLIEVMQERIQFLEKAKRDHKRGRFIPFMTPLAVFTSLLFAILVLASSGINIFSEMGIISGSTLSLAIGAIFVPYGIILDIIEHHHHKININEQNGVESELEHLTVQIVREKEKLEELRLDKSREYEITDFRTVKVDHQIELSELRKKRDFYYKLGYYLHKYYKLYLKGKLESRLESKFSEEEIKEIASYVQEKGPMTMKPKKQQGQR